METGHKERSSLWGAVLITAGVLLLLGNLRIVILPWQALMWPLMLGLAGLGFAMVYSGNRDQWWAIIPAGVLLTLAAVAFLEWLLPWAGTSWLFFFGLAVTFGLVWRETGHAQQWARVVAWICLGMTLLTVLGPLLRFAVPLALLAAGVYLLRRERPH